MYLGKNYPPICAFPDDRYKLRINHIYIFDININIKVIFTLYSDYGFRHSAQFIMADKTTSRDYDDSSGIPSQADVEKNTTKTKSTSNPDIENQNVSRNPNPQTDKGKQSTFKSLGWLDRFLAVWILLAIVLGILLGNFAPNTAEVLDRGRFVGVSIPIAVGLLVMMYPILCKVRFEALVDVFSHRGIWKQIGFSVFVNWIAAPFLMLALAWATLPDQPDLRTGLILVGLGRCIAMVLIWTDLAGGDGEYCAILVAINSILQIVLFAPLAVFFIRVISGASGQLDVPYEVVATSVAVFLGIPFGAALLSRFALRRLAGPDWYQHVFLRFVAPWSLIGLLYTVVVLFAYQGRQVVHQIVSVVRVSVPLLLYFVLVFFLALWATHRAGFGYKLGCTQSFTAASNNFELAIAVAVAVYGPHSDQALAATVGPLIEVPVLLGLVYVVKWIGKRWNWED
ncbi:sodium bile acid symporter family-domain-containing protein [Poronia punctata]|nr:sodium bile acid symporter family-domain-containing protein [Poronia punctata]